MAPEEQIEWEARAGRLAALAAFGSSALAIAGAIAYASALGSYNDSLELLVALHKHKSGALFASVIQGLAVLLLAPVLAYLYRATRYRRPETPTLAFYLVTIVPVIAAVLTVVNTALQIHAADQLFPQLPLAPKQGIQQADHFLRQGAAPVVGGVGFAAGFGLGAGVVLVALNAMRAGLLSKFMGVLGIILGVLYAIPFFFGGPAIIQFFWLIALGLLLLNRWPGGRGPAWDSGEPIPWPSAAETRQRMQPAAEPAEAPTATATATEHPRSKKKKRKRRN